MASETACQGRRESRQKNIAGRGSAHNLPWRGMIIGFAQINPTVGDLRGNCELITRSYERLMASSTEFVLTPELTITGYPPQVLVLKSRYVRENRVSLSQLHA